MYLVAAVTEHGPLTARALSETTGIVLPTTYHLLRTLVHEGYLHRDEDGRYRLGDQLTFVAQLECRARSLRLIREEMTELAAQARVSVSIGLLCGDDIVISQFIAHPCAPRFDCWPGMAIPGHATAIGKSILARMQPQQRADYLAVHSLEALTTQTVTMSWRLEKELAEAGLMHSDQQYRYGISCTATPLEGDGSLSALGAAYASDRSPRQRDRIDEFVVSAAARISDALGLAPQDGTGAAVDTTEDVPA